VGLLPTSSAATKIPIRDINKGILIQEASEVVGFARWQSNLAISGVDASDKSWVSLITQEGREIWRIFPLLVGNGGDGFITAIAVDGEGALIAGLSQNELVIPTETSSEPAPSSSPEASPPAPSPSAPAATPAPTPVLSPSSDVPVVNPDNVVPIANQPLRNDIANIFLLRIDSAGKIISVFNTENTNAFIPRSIVTSGARSFLIGNEQMGDSGSRGVVISFNEEGFENSYSYGETKTTFTRAVAPTTKTLIVVGSSADTISNRKVVGASDGIILTISQSSGKISTIIRSNGAGATRSWDFASGNLLVSGTSRVKKVREAVITSFSSKGVVNWTTRFPGSNRALASGNCVAVSMLAKPEILLYTVDSKGKRVQGLRLPQQELLALSTFPSKGCAVITRSSAAGVRVSFL
jgi:hypothetical protein